MVALMAASCSTPSPESEASLAQCQLDVHSYQGATFRKNYVDGKNYGAGNPSPKPRQGDGSYREYVLLCMQSKGFSFKTPDLNGALNTTCWVEDSEGGVPDAKVELAKCYDRSD
jgi:hypothetical protein